MSKKKVFKLTAKELKTLRGGVKMLASACNSGSWSVAADGVTATQISAKEVLAAGSIELVPSADPRVLARKALAVPNAAKAAGTAR